MSPLAPVMLDLAGRDALVVGADDDAIRRAERLLQRGARVRLLAREPTAALRTLAERAGVHIELRAARDEDMEGAAITIVATSEEAQAPPLHARALRTGQPLCTVDRPELSTFHHAAIVEAGALTIAISTSGASPALARRLREDLEAIFATPAFIEWLDALRRARESLPRGERAAKGAAAVEGFSLRGALTLPDPPDRTGDG